MHINILYMWFKMSTRTIRLKRVIMLPLGYPTSPSTSTVSHSMMIRLRPLQPQGGQPQIASRSSFLLLF